MTGERGPEKKDKNEKIPPDARIPPKGWPTKVSEGPEPPTGWIIVDEEGFMKLSIPGPINGETILRMVKHIQNVDRFCQAMSETYGRLEEKFQDLSEKIEDLMGKIERLEKRGT